MMQTQASQLHISLTMFEAFPFPVIIKGIPQAKVGQPG
jgi:hypothetical protein